MPAMPSRLSASSKLPCSSERYFSIHVVPSSFFLRNAVAMLCSRLFTNVPATNTPSARAAFFPAPGFFAFTSSPASIIMLIHNVGSAMKLVAILSMVLVERIHSDFAKALSYTCVNRITSSNRMATA